MKSTLIFGTLLLKNQNKKINFTQLSQLAQEPAFNTGKNVLNLSDQKFETLSRKTFQII